MKIRYAAKTDVGMKRTHNEDYFSLIEDEQLFIVADGMGGHSSGEVASKMAAETIGEFYQRTREDEDVTWPYKMDRSLSYIENRLVCAIKLANLRIFETSCRDIRYKGMGTTIVSCLVAGDKAYIGHVGDSRVYRVREGQITQLTPRPLAARGLQGSQARHDRGGRAQLPPQERHHPGPGDARDRSGRHPAPTRSRAATCSSCARTACPAW
jgi:serine/threonine protein phosphatase PrpC